MIVFPVDPKDQQRFNELITYWLESEHHLGADDFEECLGDLYAGRFPEWPLLQQRARCKRVAPELLLMARSQYRHHLSGLHKHFLLKGAQRPGLNVLGTPKNQRLPTANPC